jgi:MFS transporter, FSR family, fosmidomycin resistance protein
MQKDIAQHKPTATIFPILLAISFAHLLNDSVQSVIPASFPILKQSLHLSFTQIGLIAFTFHITGGILQPLIGIYTDIRPKPFLLPVGMGFTLAGVVVFAWAAHFSLILLAVSLIGMGSAVLHPECSRVAFLAAGHQRGFAQSIFQIGGNMGYALGPLFTVWLIVPLGQRGIIWFSVAALVGIVIQLYVAMWYRKHIPLLRKPTAGIVDHTTRRLPRKLIWRALTILVLLVFSKQVYVAGLSGFYSFYLIQYQGMSVAGAQWYLFILLIASVVGTFLGGPLADRLGRRNIIWFSILGPAPFSILLPFANLFWSAILLALIGFILSMAFSVIVVYAQELLPNQVGMVSGLFFGMAFGFGGMGAAILGYLADLSSIRTIMQMCAYLPLIGLLTVWLPADQKRNRKYALEDK